MASQARRPGPGWPPDLAGGLSDGGSPGPTRRCSSHDRPLVRVAITSATKDGRQPTGGQWTQCSIAFSRPSAARSPPVPTECPRPPRCSRPGAPSSRPVRRRQHRARHSERTGGRGERVCKLRGPRRRVIARSPPPSPHQSDVSFDAELGLREDECPLPSRSGTRRSRSVGGLRMPRDGRVIGIDHCLATGFPQRAAIRRAGPWPPRSQPWSRGSRGDRAEARPGTHIQLQPGGTSLSEHGS